MAIQCPYCEHSLGLKGAKPGRYTTKCPKCARKFLLAVPEDPAAPPKVSAIRAEVDSTVTLQPAPSAGETETAAGPGEASAALAPESQATGAWSGAPAGPVTAATLPQADETMPEPAVRGAQATAMWAPTAPAPVADTRDAGAPEATSAQGFELGSSAAAARPADMPATLGGYQVLQELGRGGMGAVYLARQISLNRNVALKVMRPEWCRNPTFVSRFTREAYAAAQLVHHNVVQIYDFGVDRGTNFFSMEFVQGQTLSSLVRTQKKLDPEVAVGFVLQAARGLKYAHDQGMIHRDIKPENLLLNDQGVVKVADLGLVKTPALAEVEEARESNTAVVAAPAGPVSIAGSSGQITMANVAMGTPAFMAPEQARDAAGVDQRADIYSLGCTLYDLITGRPPFEGKTAVELISKHQTEPVVPPEAIVKRVSPALSAIILKMVAKKPEDRYSYLGDVIKALEEFLGVPSTGVFSPREEHANLLQECAERFNSAPTARLRPRLIFGGLALCAAVVVLAALGRQPFLAAGFFGLGLMSALAYFVVTGVMQGTYLFQKTRALLLGSSLFEWLMLFAGLFLFVTAVVVFHLTLAWITFGIVAVLIAIGLYAAIDKKVEAERRDPIERTEEMLRKMRLHGLDEESVRQFVCKYSGERWEAFYEALFGYEAKLQARDKWGRGERGRMRKTYGAWRDPVVRWIDAKQQVRREAREKRLLQKIEEESLEAKGVNLMTARRQAQRAAEAMVTMASELREAEKVPAAVRGERLAIARAMQDAAAKPEMVLVDREKGLYGPRTDGPLNLVLGAGPRFLAGAALLVGCLFWMHQNQLLTREKLEEARQAAQELSSKVKTAASEVAKSKDLSRIGDAKSFVPESNVLETPSDAKPLSLPFLPKGVTRLFNSYNPGIAGLILLISSLFGGVRMSFFAVPAAAITWLGPTAGLGVWPSIGIGVVVAVVGVIFGRTRY